MSIQKYNHQGDTNIGFYATITNDYAVLPRKFDREKLELDKAVQTRITGTEMIGLFTAGNSNCLLLPDSVKDREIEKIEKAEIKYRILESKENALGNIILSNDKGAVISPHLKEKKSEIEDALEVPVTTAKIAGIPNPGVCGIANSRGALIHRDATEKEAEIVRETLGVEKINVGTVNTGSPYLGSGTLVNDHTILAGEDTSGPEIGRMDRILVEKEQK